VASTRSSGRVLSLDGGGAKGFYTIGILSELEAMMGAPLCEHFALIFGTSTGAILASLLALGYTTRDIVKLYSQHVPNVMREQKRSGRSQALTHLAKSVFGELKFTDVKTNVGVVATRWDFETPMIFKSSASQAHGARSSFVPGFGCLISDAVCASCSAYPFFNRSTIHTAAGERVELVDGGYCANNPTLYAIADALNALHIQRSELRVLSLGVGNYPRPKRWNGWIPFFKERAARRVLDVELLQKTLDINTASMEQLRRILFTDIATVRVSETFERPEMATDLLESDPNKLNLLYQRGRQSFANFDPQLRQLLS
jgi:uncharacterized protein